MKTDQKKLTQLMSRRTVIALDGEVWTAKPTPAEKPMVLAEVARRYPGTVVLNALPVHQALDIYQASRPAV